MIKYGVVDRNDLIDDLEQWGQLYLAGRLHKPVRALLSPNADMKLSINSNLRHAVTAALCQLPEHFREVCFQTFIASKLQLRLCKKGGFIL